MFKDFYGERLERLNKFQRLFCLSVISLYRMSKLSGNPDPDITPAIVGDAFEELGSFPRRTHELVLDEGEEFDDGYTPRQEIGLYIALYLLFEYRNPTDDDLETLTRALAEPLQDQSILETVH